MSGAWTTCSDRTLAVERDINSLLDYNCSISCPKYLQCKSLKLVKFSFISTKKKKKKKRTLDIFGSNQMLLFFCNLLFIIDNVLAISNDPI